jgi:PKHD-type hydroxylase
MQTARESQIAWLGPRDIEFAFRKVTDAVMSLNNQFFKFNLFGLAEGFQFTRYDAPSGFYCMHVDKTLNGPVRKLSLTIQLSDPEDYEGGELALQYGKEPEVMSKELGKLVAFPSYTLHEVRPVTKGTRYSLVAWVTGTPFK